ncbi:MAG: choice-of-anchor D domain-containing protein [Candidatus Zhuqueibacterota bacterium]
MKKAFTIFIIASAVLFTVSCVIAQQKDTLYVDDLDKGNYYFEYGGPWENGDDWQGSAIAGWGSTSRQVRSLDNPDFDESAEWRLPITTSGYYATYFILPENGNSRNSALYVVQPFGAAPDSMRIDQRANSGQWIFMGVYYFLAGAENSIWVHNDSVSTAGYMFRADAVRLVTCPETKDIEPIRRNKYDFGECAMTSYKDWMLRVYNLGATTLTIHSATTTSGVFSVPNPLLPATIPARDYIDLTVRFAPNFEKIFEDVLTISSDDVDEPFIDIPLQGQGTTMTVIVNNDDGYPYYMEHIGQWNNSTDAANIGEWFTNKTSRYSIQSQNPGARCQFVPDIPKSGYYSIYYCGPTTSNASNHALYEVMPFGSKTDSVWINQNSSSPDEWKFIGTYYLFEGMDMNTVFTVNDGTGQGYVVRADLLKFTYVPTVPDIELVESSHTFTDVPIHTNEDWSFIVKNIGNENLTINNVRTESPYFSIVSPVSFPVYIPRLSESTVTVRFSPIGINAFQDTVFIESDDIDEPVTRVYLKGNGIGSQLIVDDSDTLTYFSKGPSDTTWHISESLFGYNGNSSYTGKYANPDAWAQWNLNVDVTMNYDVYASSVPSSNSTFHAPYIINLPGILPDTVIVSQNSSTTADNIWIYLGTYQFISGFETSVRLVNDTTITYQDTMSILRADAIKLSQPTKIALSAFNISYEEENIVINWATSSETDHGGFNLYRQTVDFFNERRALKLNIALITGESPYRFVDMTADFGTSYYYWLEDISIYGQRALHGPISGNLASALPHVYQLEQNYPNPFNPKTTIRFSLPEANHVEIYVLNVLGQRVRTLIDADIRAGFHKTIWDGRNDLGQDVTSGVYFITMKCGDVKKLRKIMLVK